MIFLSIILSVIVSAELDSSFIMLGDQTRMHVSAVATEGEHVALPVFGSEITSGVEIVSRTAIDSARRKDGRVEYSQDYVLTSFKDSLFCLPAFDFTAGADTFRSAPMSLNVVQPFELDTADNAIADIKPVQKPDIWWWGILRWVLLVVLVAAGLFLAVFLYRRFAKHKEEKAEPVDPELLRPCDEVALEKLDAIKEAKRWQTGEHKEYFSDLTFVIREYIGRRFSVRSTEKTSDETLSAMKPILQERGQKDLYGRLDKMLRLADLVKFAKWQPTPDENELALKEAYTFVNETRYTDEEKDRQRNVTDADFSEIEMNEVL